MWHQRVLSVGTEENDAQAAGGSFWASTEDDNDGRENKIVDALIGGRKFCSIGTSN